MPGTLREHLVSYPLNTDCHKRRDQIKQLFWGTIPFESGPLPLGGKREHCAQLLSPVWRPQDHHLCSAVGSGLGSQTRVSLTFKNQDEPTGSATPDGPTPWQALPCTVGSGRAPDRRSTGAACCTGELQSHLPPMLLSWDPKHQANREAEATLAYSAHSEAGWAGSTLRSKDHS